MRLNRNGKLAKFYMWLPPNDKKLPDDFCTYFWGLLGRAFFVFIMGGSVVLSGIYWLIQLILWLTRLVWTHKLATLYLVGFLLMVTLIVWLSQRKKKIRIEILSEAKTIIAGKVDAVKNRYCPRIEWR